MNNFLFLSKLDGLGNTSQSPKFTSLYGNSDLAALGSCSSLLSQALCKGNDAVCQAGQHHPFASQGVRGTGYHLRTRIWNLVSLSRLRRFCFCMGDLTFCSEGANPAWARAISVANAVWLGSAAPPKTHAVRRSTLNKWQGCY